MSELVDNLKNLYEQLYDVSISIGQLIEIADFASIEPYMELKDNIVKNIEAILPGISESELPQFEEICNKIQAQEQMNITVLTGFQDKLKKELSKVNKKTKLANAYSNVETKQGNLLDFRQ